MRERNLKISLLLLAFSCRSGYASERPNVLFIAVDDLRPELGCYGAEHIRSPSIDRFATSALRFDRAYCQQAVCNPSRTSLMTGLRPDTIGVTGNHSHFRSNMPDVVTLPQHFKNHGYYAAAIGKLYHGVFPDGCSNTKWDTMGDPASWSVPAVRFGPRYYYTEDGIAVAVTHRDIDHDPDSLSVGDHCVDAENWHLCRAVAGDGWRGARHLYVCPARQPWGLQRCLG